MTLVSTSNELEVPGDLVPFFAGVPEDRSLERPTLVALAGTSVPQYPLWSTAVNLWTLGAVGFGPSALVALSGGSERMVMTVFVMSLIAAGAWFLASNLADRDAIYRARGRDASALQELQDDYARRVAQWEATAPLRLIEASPFPHETAQILLNQARGTVYLGVDSDTSMLSVAQRNQSVLILAAPQSGKTTGIADPALMTALGPVVATSTKPDTLWATYKARQSMGTCWLFDPTGSVTNVPPGVHRAFWSPLQGCTDWDTTTLTATALVEATSVASGKDPHWKERAEQWLAPLLFAAALHQDTTMLDVWEWVSIEEFDEPLQILTTVAADTSHPCARGARIAKAELNSIRRTQDRERDGIRSTLTVVLKVYRLESVQEAQDDVNFDPFDFVYGTDTLYIVARSENQRSTAQLNSGLIERIRLEVLRHNEHQPFLESQYAPVLFLLDEMAHVAPLPQLPTYLGESPGQGAQFVVVLQTRAQAKKQWPQEEGSILDLFAIKVAFGGLTDPDTLRALSALAGDYDREYRTTNTSVSRGVSTSDSDSKTSSLGSWGSTSRGTTTGTSETFTTGSSVSYKKERRLSEADVAAIPRGQALVVRGNNWSFINIVGTFDDAWKAVTAQAEPYRGPAPELLGRQTPSEWTPLCIEGEEPGGFERDLPDLPPFRVDEAAPSSAPGQQVEVGSVETLPIPVCPECQGHGTAAGCPECDEVAS